LCEENILQIVSQQQFKYLTMSQCPNISHQHDDEQDYINTVCKRQYSVSSFSSAGTELTRDFDIP